MQNLYNPLLNISPLDGRYHDKLDTLRPLVSEYGLMRFRLNVEIEWFIHLSKHELLKEIPALQPAEIKFLYDIVHNFSLDDAEQIKTIEKETRHDVKAIEYFLKTKMEHNSNLASLKEFIHFACTSEDINNLSYACMLRDVRVQCLLPALEKITRHLRTLSHQYANVAMLSRTHGQIATPTTFGKEMANVVARLSRQQSALKNAEISGKINGAVGNFNAHVCAYPELDWLSICQTFVENLQLHWEPYTTQIDPHDNLATFLDIVSRINIILIDFSRDIWTYISQDYLSQKMNKNDVGSSTMPHKINPIDFENAEGNLGVSIALSDHLSNKLPISRLQRDLSDSTVLRNLGLCFGHALLGYQAISAGLDKITLNQEKLSQDLANHWEVLSEAIQTVMRRYGVDTPYEKLKALTRGQDLDRKKLHAFIDAQILPDPVKIQLKLLRPDLYIGYAERLATELGSHCPDEP